MTFPKNITISDQLSIQIYLHQFFLGDRDRKCWTYITTGLVTHQQKEMCLSLIIEDDEDSQAFPRTPLKIFELLEKHASEGKIVNVGDATRLGKTGLFGFTALFYLPAIQYESLPDLTDHLALTLVHQSEYQFAKTAGLTRLISRIGKYCSSFPYPTWNTQLRPALYPDDYQENTVLQGRTTMNSKHALAELTDQRVTLTLAPADTRNMLLRLEQLQTQQTPFVIKTGLSVQANACLYWQPEQQSPGAYTAADTSSRIMAAFILFGMEHQSSGKMMEDGFVFSLSKQSLKILQQKVRAQENGSVPGIAGLNLWLNWQAPPPQLPARRYFPKAAWRTLATEHPGTTLRSLKINATTISSISELQPPTQRFIQELQTFLSESMANETDKFLLSICLEIINDNARYSISADIPLNTDFIDFIVSGMNKLDSSQLSEIGQLEFTFVVND